MAGATRAGRNPALDLLKLGLAVMVVGIHVNPFGIDNRALVLLTGDGLFRLAVPAFFVINGYFFEPKALAGRALPYIRHLLWLYLVWMLLYLPVWEGAWRASDWVTILRVWLVGWWHLWYLVAAALAAAIAALVCRWPTRRLLELMALAYAGGVAVTLAFALEIWRPSAPWIGSPVWLHRNGLFLGLPFFLAGMLIRRHDLPARLNPGLVTGAALAATLALLAESLALEAFAPRPVSHDNLLSLTLAAPALVIRALQADLRGSARDLGSYANGIFFLHVFFVALLIRLTDLPYPAVFLLTLAGSALLVRLILRLRLDRWLL